jgi:hypothetical protein
MAITAMRMARVAKVKVLMGKATKAAMISLMGAAPVLPAFQKLASLILEAVQRTVPLMHPSVALLEMTPAGATPVNPTHVRKRQAQGHALTNHSALSIHLLISRLVVLIINMSRESPGHHFAQMTKVSQKLFASAPMIVSSIISIKYNKVSGSIL